MLEKVIVTNYLGDSMEYKIEGVQPDDESGLLITSIDGLGPGKATINMSDMATRDGQVYNSSRLSGRNIVISALFNDATSVEESRHLSYQYFPIKSKVNIMIITTSRTCEVDGYVESNEPAVFGSQCGCKISILCESPYFLGDTIEDYFGADAQEHIIEYTGDAKTGATIIYEPAVDIDGLNIYGTHSPSNEQVSSMELDFSKMSSVVPNSAPTGLSVKKCSFKWIDEDDQTLQHDIYKFFSELPVPITNAYDHALVHHNSIYLIKSYRLGDELGECGMYTYNPDSYSWTRVCDLPPSEFHDDMDMTVRFAVVYNNEIHIIGDFTGDSTLAADAGRRILFHYKYNGSGWTKIQTQLPMYWTDGCIVILDGYIHLIGATCSYSGGSTKGHYRWQNGDDWTYVTDNPMHTSGTAAVLNGAIHAIEYYSSRTVHYTYTNWDGWTEVETLSSRNIGEGVLLVAGLDLHYFCSTSGNAYTYHWIYEYGDWRQYDNQVPYQFNTKCAVSIVREYHGSHPDIYLFGGKVNDSSTYTETPNNTHLVDGDKLVIVTNVGKKSITLQRRLNTYNVLNTIGANTKWLELIPGDNDIMFQFLTEAYWPAERSLTFTTKELYQGV